MNLKLNKKSKIFILIVFIFWSVFILYASLAPGDDLPPPEWMKLITWIPYYDKLIHFGLYFVETLLMALFFGCGKRCLIIGLGLIIACSGIIELLQGEFFDRSKDIWDFCANALGVIAGRFVAPLLVNTTQKNNPETMSTKD